MTDPSSAILSACSSPLAIFTDFDGTLVEIAESPGAVHVPSHLTARLKALDAALSGAFAIVTGRTIADIDAFLSVRIFTISGGHGAECRHAGKIREPDAALGAAAQSIAASLRSAMGNDDRILIEIKPAGVALHYRAAPERRDEAHSAMSDIIAGFKDFHFIEGKKVVEARPKGIDKGAAVAALMELEPFVGRTPIFIGDDVTDEDGFDAVQSMNGAGIKIGPGPTTARFSLPDVNAVYDFLDRVPQLQTGLTSRPAKPEGQQQGIAR